MRAIAAYEKSTHSGAFLRIGVRCGCCVRLQQPAPGGADAAVQPRERIKTIRRVAEAPPERRAARKPVAGGVQGAAVADSLAGAAHGKGCHPCGIGDAVRQIADRLICHMMLALAEATVRQNRHRPRRIHHAVIHAHLRSQLRDRQKSARRAEILERNHLLGAPLLCRERARLGRVALTVKQQMRVHPQVLPVRIARVDPFHQAVEIRAVVRSHIHADADGDLRLQQRLYVVRHDPERAFAALVNIRLRAVVYFLGAVKRDLHPVQLPQRNRFGNRRPVEQIAV